jgi:hypothetical protein
VWELVDISAEQGHQATILEGTMVDWVQPWEPQPTYMEPKAEHTQAAAHFQWEEVHQEATTPCTQVVDSQEAETQDRRMEEVAHQEVEVHWDFQEVADHQEEAHQDHQEAVVEEELQPGQE